MSLGGPQELRRLRGKVQSNAIFHLQSRLLPQLLNVANKLASHPLLSQLLVDPGVEQQLGPVINEPRPILRRLGFYDQHGLDDMTDGAAVQAISNFPDMLFACT